MAECSAAHYRRRREASGQQVREKAGVPAGRGLRRTCGETEPHSERHRNAAASDGPSTRCRARGPLRGRQDPLRRRHVLNEAERDELVVSHGGVCRVCLSALPEHVDHRHETGRVRGVLCFSCNAALGQFKDRPDAIRRAAAYVEGNAWKPTLVAPGVYRLPS
ncbi:endonuclease VII domain-containing protein [Streptomyces sennicomposti]